MRDVTSEVPDKLSRATREAKAVSQSVQRLGTERDRLVGDISDHIVDVMPHVTQLSILTSRVKELEKYTQYLLCISQFEDLRFETNRKISASVQRRMHYLFRGMGCFEGRRGGGAEHKN